MNLYLRLLLTVLKALRAPRIQRDEPIELELRVLPNDLDLNGHMNNGRYLTLVDLALVTLFIRSGFARLCAKKGWRPMGGGSIVYFRRQLTLFQRYTLRLAPAAWDGYWNYLRFEFVRDGQLCATGFIKGALSRPGGLVPTAEIFPALGFDPASPAMPDDLVAWIAADRRLGDQFRRA